MSVTIKPADVKFERVKAVVPKTINLVVESLDGAGKTHFGLTGPEPIAAHNFDNGLHRALPKFPEKEVYKFDYEFPRTLRLPGQEFAGLSDAAAKVWQEFVINSRAAVEKCRTNVIDTGSKAWELLRLARLGKLTQVMPIQYTAVNQEFQELIQVLHRSQANNVWLHRLKPVYVDDKKVEGKFERAGFGEMAFEVDAVLRLTFDEKEGLKLRFGKCANRALTGTEIKGEENISLPQIAALIYPAASEETWK